MFTKSRPIGLIPISNTEFVVVRSFEFKMHQIHFQLGLCSRPGWGSLRPSDFLVGWRRVYLVYIPLSLDAFAVSISPPSATRIQSRCHSGILTGCLNPRLSPGWDISWIVMTITKASIRGLTTSYTLVLFFWLEMNVDVWKTCRRLGELLRQEQERLRAMMMEGHTIYREYAQQGQDAKISKQVRTDGMDTSQVPL